MEKFTSSLLAAIVLIVLGCEEQVDFEIVEDQSSEELEQLFDDKDLMSKAPILDYSCSSTRCYCATDTWEGVWDCITMGREKCRGSKIVCVSNFCGCNIGSVTAFKRELDIH